MTTKFHENPLVGSNVMRMDTQTDLLSDLISLLSFFLKVGWNGREIHYCAHRVVRNVTSIALYLQNINIQIKQVWTLLSTRLEIVSYIQKTVTAFGYCSVSLQKEAGWVIC